MLAMFVAMNRQAVIGDQNRLPWHISEDLKRFKKITEGHPVIMGRKTFQSIGKCLPNRTNIIVSRDLEFQVPGAVMARSLEEAVKPYSDRLDDKDEEVFVMGGAEIYRQAYGLCDRLYLTEIDNDTDGDTKFPFPNWRQDFVVIEEIPSSTVQKDGSVLHYRFIVAERKR